MKNKYNIALIPMHTSNLIITLSNKLSHIADQYILGENSLPHVTLCQFIASEDALADIWDKVCDSLQHKIIDLVFMDISCITLNNIIHWISLLPNNNDKLSVMNVLVADIIKNPVSKSYKEYVPHMTLVNTKNKDYEKFAGELSKSYEPIADTFILSLGKSDEIGQYTKMIYQYAAKA